jgi:hypothetical protein
VNNEVPAGSRASIQQSPETVCTRSVYVGLAIVNAVPDASVAVTSGTVVVGAARVVVVGLVAGGLVVVVGAGRSLPLPPRCATTIPTVTTVATAMTATASHQRVRGAIGRRVLVVAGFFSGRADTDPAARVSSVSRARDAASCTALSVRRCRSTDCSTVSRRPRNTRRSTKMTRPRATAISNGKGSFSPMRQASVRERMS